MGQEVGYKMESLGQAKAQEIHRDRIAQVYFGQTSDNETQRRARERIDWTLEQVSGKKVYDIGCSEGVTAIKLAQMGCKVDAVDINPEVIEYAQDLVEKIAPEAVANVNFFVCDIFTVPEIKPEYDTVVLGEVLEHVYEPSNMIKRSVLSMKVGGQIIITTPWGYFPAPDHHQTFFMGNFLALIPSELACTHLSVVDGYIRFIAQKTHDPLSGAPAKKTSVKSVALDDTTLLHITETAAMEGQVFLRNHLNSRNDFLEQARAQAVKLAHAKTLAQNAHNDSRNETLNLRDEARALHNENKELHLKVAKQLRYVQGLHLKVAQQLRYIERISMERSLFFPKSTARLRSVRRTIRLEGLRPAVAIYAKAVARRLLRGKLGSKVAGVLPAQAKKEAFAALEQSIVRLDATVKEGLQKAAQGDFIIICNSFPGTDQNYGGEFIRSRYSGYLDQGFKGSVVHLSNRITTSVMEPFEGTEDAIIRISDAHLSTLAPILAAGQAKVLIHSPPPNVQKALQKKIAPDRLTYWFHGFEVRDYRRLYFNYSTSELAVQKQRLNEITQWRIDANKISFADPAIKKVFVSNYLKDIAERDNGAQVKNGHIIPNFIDGTVFEYQAKTEEQMTKFLFIRAFSRRNYGNDIAIEAIKIASKWDGFEDLHFTIRGFGTEFAELTEDLKDFSNVVLEEQYSMPEEMAALHKQHGIFLCPSRFDTQGVTMGEAMASGLVCITNSVAGIPEYIDESCGLLASADDPMAYAKAIWHAKENPAAMLELSKAAADRARTQCGRDHTVSREIELAMKSSS